MTPSILITIDVEDWFQVENFKQYIPFSSWPQKELRVEKNVHRLLDLFDSRNPQPATRNMEPGYEMSAVSNKESSPKKLKATFFILGWIAERLPNLVCEIQARGHEVASHGFSHNLCNEEPKDRLKQDLLDSKKLLEDIISAPVLGYRAPSFSISDNTLKLIEECGYLYDSSYNSFAMHGRYGQISFNGSYRKGIAHRITKNFFELPISNLTLCKKDRLLKNADFYSSSRKKRNLTTPVRSTRPTGQADIQEVFRGLKLDSDVEIGQISARLRKAAFFKGFVLPWGGGAYFRIIPFSIFKRGVKSILKKENAYLFYMHPWAIDPDQPRVSKASSFCKFKHYINLNKNFLKLTHFIEYFGQCRFVSCRQYLDKVYDS